MNLPQALLGSPQHELPFDHVYVFTEADDGELRFHRAEPPTDDEIAQLLLTIRKRVLRHLERNGLSGDDDASIDPLSEQAPLLASCYATSIGGRQTLGSRPGARLQRIGHDTDAPFVASRGRLQAHVDGFDLHAGLAVPADKPEGRLPLEKLARYCARPPIAQDRLSQLPDGRIALQLKTPWRDGTTHVVYEPLDFVAKLAALIPRPRKNLVLYHGVLSPHAAWRSRVVTYGRPQQTEAAASVASAATPPKSPRRRWSWAELMRRAFHFDVLRCPRCSGKMVLLACILERSVIRKILAHLQLPTDLPSLAPARGSPQHQLPFDHVA